MKTKYHLDMDNWISKRCLEKLKCNIEIGFFLNNVIGRQNAKIKIIFRLKLTKLTLKYIDLFSKKYI